MKASASLCKQADEYKRGSGDSIDYAVIEHRTYEGIERRVVPVWLLSDYQAESTDVLYRTDKESAA